MDERIERRFPAALLFSHLRACYRPLRGILQGFGCVDPGRDRYDVGRRDGNRRWHAAARLIFTKTGSPCAPICAHTQKGRTWR